VWLVPLAVEDCLGAGQPVDRLLVLTGTHVGIRLPPSTLRLRHIELRYLSGQALIRGCVTRRYRRSQCNRQQSDTAGRGHRSPTNTSAPRRTRSRPRAQMLHRELSSLHVLEARKEAEGAAGDDAAVLVEH